MRVALVSTHRSDRGHYAPLERLLRADPAFEIVADQPDVAVVLGDRVEMLQRAIDFADARVPVVHIHGGEHSIGSLDERWRWAITMVADLHCVATVQAQWEVDKHVLYDGYGTPDDTKPGFTDAYRKISLRSFITGAPGLDGIREARQPVQGAVDILVHYNPALTEALTRSEWAAIVMAMARIERPSVQISPNGDRYSDAIALSGLHAHELGPETYRDILAAARVIVGNSSAGIIEAPSLGTWTVNVGARQRHRERADSVVDVPADADAIAVAIADALERPPYDGGNPYDPFGDGMACERIRGALLTLA